MKPNAALWVRPDAARFYKPGTRMEDIFPTLALKDNPNQPRVPAGNSDGGQWTDGEGGSGVAAYLSPSLTSCRSPRDLPPVRFADRGARKAALRKIAQPCFSIATGTIKCSNEQK